MKIFSAWFSEVKSFHYIHPNLCHHLCCCHHNVSTVVFSGFLQVSADVFKLQVIAISDFTESESIFLCFFFKYAAGWAAVKFQDLILVVSGWRTLILDSNYKFFSFMFETRDHWWWVSVWSTPGSLAQVHLPRKHFSPICSSFFFLKAELFCCIFLFVVLFSVGDTFHKFIFVERHFSKVCHGVTSAFLW